MALNNIILAFKFLIKETPASKLEPLGGFVIVLGRLERSAFSLGLPLLLLPCLIVFGHVLQAREELGTLHVVLRLRTIAARILCSLGFLLCGLFLEMAHFEPILHCNALRTFALFSLQFLVLQV